VRKAGIHISDKSMKIAFKASFKKMSYDHPIYGLNSGLSSPNEWWLLLIRSILKHAGFAERLIDRLMPTLGPSLLHLFSSAEGYRLAEGVPGIFRLLKKLRDETTTTTTTDASTRSLRWNLATNSDARILLACSALGLDRFINVTTAGIHGLEDYQPPQPQQAESPSSSSSTSSSAEDAEESKSSSFYEESPTSAPSLSYSLGSQKPDKAFFHQAVLRSFPQDTTQSLAELCAQTLYIGDDIKEDYQAARRAGLQAAWLQRDQDWPPNVIAREDEMALKSISQIIDVIRDSWSKEDSNPSV
jgi:FMN phosphatase YigB (HAD superfamily)